jgi:predicted peptidase
MFCKFSFEEFVSANTGKKLHFLFRQPKSSVKLPLILYLHGAGSRGDNLEKMATAGPIGEVENGRDVHAIIAAPQCRDDTWFESFETLIDFAEEMLKKEEIDKSRVYLCGVSMGAYAAWQLAMTKPQWFAALVAVCGGGMYWNAERLRNIPVWAFHGELDTTVLPGESEKMVEAVNACGGKANLTLYQGVAHDSWIRAFSDDEMWNWLFMQKKE